jgi:hypothetical protein
MNGIDIPPGSVSPGGFEGSLSAPVDFILIKKSYSPSKRGTNNTSLDYFYGTIILMVAIKIGVSLSCASSRTCRLIQSFIKQERGMTMKTIFSTLALVGIGFLVGSCASTPGRGSGEPDLVVTRLEKTGPPTVNGEGRVEVPLRVVVRNQGTGPAEEVFKTALEYQYHHHHGPYGVPLTVPGQEDPNYAWTRRPLAAGRKVTFSGKAVFPEAVRDVPVTLTAVVDSCGGETSMPPSCRVAERNKDNNRSDPLILSLP